MKKIILFFMISIFSFAAEKEAYFAGGCFWCMEPPFETLAGVISVTSGYSGGDIENPSYKEVASGKTKHREAVKIIYEDSVVIYPELLEIFWKQIDPTDPGGQFVDRGFQYSSAIFYANEEQKSQALKSLENLENSKKFEKKIVTDIVKFKNFYPAEEYHQDYYKKNKLRYKFYRYNSGRDKFLNSIWK
ncbi:peptide-methionine (S)-S-oxide reductase MsrA [uncultured Ilyobacter sp.]|uniref:peptide-methionine (S)-S-oxide reductase MsrA n=1 Tax=uncultured Ilyobacter sp. TaxID=544433 RepID=UPI0029C02B4B|nr:peptide-methionine (S)-S-oxide reductase MsrA [uncultured Ilyobacter sp.]